MKHSYNLFVQCLEPSIFCLPGELLGRHKYWPQTRNCQLSFHFYHRKMSLKVILLLCLASLCFGLPNPIPQYDDYGAQAVCASCKISFLNLDNFGLRQCSLFIFLAQIFKQSVSSQSAVSQVKEQSESTQHSEHQNQSQHSEH